MENEKIEGTDEFEKMSREELIAALKEERAKTKQYENALKPLLDAIDRTMEPVR